MIDRDPITPTPGIRAIVGQLLVAGRNGDGLSVSPRTGMQPQGGGYMVGGVTEPFTCKISELKLDPRRTFDCALQHVMRKMSQHFGDTSVYLGVWVDGEGPDATVYLDASNHVQFAYNALGLAQERGELAIWDLEKEVEVRL